MSEGKGGKNTEGTPPVVIKTEGTSRAGGPLMRLPSFRQPRDLTLGGGNSSRGGLSANKNRKNFAPNLNVQRNKNKDDVKVKDEPKTPRNQDRGRGRGRGRGDRGRGRGANVIQSSGVFSEGIAAAPKVNHFRERDNDTSASFIPKPKLDLQQNLLADAKEEGERLKQLLNDNFIDDPDSVGRNGIKPLQLPMLPPLKRSGGPMVKKEKFDLHVKPDPDAPESDSNIKIKSEPSEDGETQEEEKKNIVETEGRALYERGVVQLLGSREPEYVLFQLPDCLPGLKPSTEAESGKGSNPTSNPPSSLTAENAPKPQCTLSTLPEGLIGHIQLLRSGRARLKVGPSSLPIAMGTQVSFKQDLISIKLDENEKAGSMVNLGQVRARMVITPDWEAMLGKA